MMAFDALRSIEKVDADEVVFDVTDDRLNRVEHDGLVDAKATVVAEHEALVSALDDLLATDRDVQEAHAKQRDTMAGVRPCPRPATELL